MSTLARVTASSPAAIASTESSSLADGYDSQRGPGTRLASPLPRDRRISSWSVLLFAWGGRGGAAIVGWFVTILLRTLVASAITIGAANALACSCGPKPDPVTAQSRASYTVVGTVATVRPGVIVGHRLLYPEELSRPQLVPVTFLRIDVQHGFGRRPPASLELTHVGCCVCEETLEEGKTYLLFIRPSYIVRDAWMVSLCHPNMRVETAGAAIRLLGNPEELFAGTLRERLASSAPRFWYESVLHVVANNLVDRHPYEPTLWSRVRESPWTPFAGTMAGGVLITIVAVRVRRRRPT